MSREKKSADSTRELMRVREITDYSLVTTDGELTFYIIKPTNIAVLSDATVGSTFTLFSMSSRACRSLNFCVSTGARI